MIETLETPVKDLWRLFRIMAEFTEGFEELASVGPAVSFFGSARAEPEERYYKLAEETASEVVKAGFAVITGGGGGIMEAANKGAAGSGGKSIGRRTTLAVGCRSPESVANNTCAAFCPVSYMSTWGAV